MAGGEEKILVKIQATGKSIFSLLLLVFLTQ
jgi:hypothetical protein